MTIGPRYNYRLLQQRRTLTVVAVLVVGLALSSVLFLKMRADANDRLIKVFERDARERVAIFVGALNERIMDINALRHLCSVSEQLSYETFHDFTLPFLLGRTAVRAFAWVPRVADADRAAFEQQAQQAGLNSFVITERDAQGSVVPATVRAEYYPIMLVTSLSNYIAAVGCDLGADAQRRTALEQACDSGNITVTRLLPLRCLDSQRQSVVLVAPVYRPAVLFETATQRRAALRGFVLCVFHPDDLLLERLRDLPIRGLRTVLSDVTEIPSGERLCHVCGRQSRVQCNDNCDSAFTGFPRLAHTFRFAARDWRITEIASSKYCSANLSRLYWLALLFGIPLTVVLSAYLFMVLWSQTRAERLIEARTVALRDNEARFRALFEQAAVGVAQINTRTGHIVMTNDKYCAILGYAPGELTGRDVKEISYPEDLKDDAASLQAMQTGAARELTREKRYYRKDGSLVWTSLAVSPLWAPGAAPSYHMAVIQDITARKESDALLQIERERAQRYLDIAPAIILALNPVGVVTMINHAGCALLECSAEEVVGKRTGLPPSCHPRRRKR